MDIADVARLVKGMTPEQRARVVHVDEVNLDNPKVIYIGRANRKRGLPASSFANPFPLPEGKQWDQAERKACLRKFTEAVLAQPGYVDFFAPILTGKTLACFCRDRNHPNALCHGLVLLAISEHLYRDCGNSIIEEL